MSGAILYPYQPKPGSGIPVTNATVTNLPVAVEKGLRQVCVVNGGATGPLCVRINPPGDSSVATANDQQVLPGQSRVFTKDEQCSQINVFNAGTGAAVGQVTSGTGF